MLPVAIIAGGLATRLQPITTTIPKSLVDVAGKPFIEHQLQLLRAAGASRVVLCLGHLGEQVEELVGNGDALGLDVVYSYDGGELVGTGGALRRALPLLGDTFLVLYGDSYLRCDYAAIAEVFLASGKLGLMTVFRNDGQYDASNVRFQDGEIRVYDKTPGLPGMTHIDWGLGALRAAALDGFPDGKLDLAVVYRALLARDELVGYEVFERFYEIGSFAGLEDTRRLLSAKESP
jgi:N-acetyl-alpha-D-muramate 1-phosphate uridylyltransferase